MAPLGRADEGDFTGAVDASGEVLEPGLSGVDTSAKGGAGEAEALDRDRWEASARVTASARAAQGVPAATAARAMERQVAAGSSRSSRRSGVPRHASRQRMERTAARAASAVARREMIAERSSNGRLLMRSSPPASRGGGAAISPPGFCGGLGGEGLFTGRTWSGRRESEKML